MAEKKAYKIFSDVVREKIYKMCFLLTTFVLVVLLISCENSIHSFAGTYEIKTEVTIGYEDYQDYYGFLHDIVGLTSLVNITYKNGYSVQTDFLGLPKYDVHSQRLNIKEKQNSIGDQYPTPQRTPVLMNHIIRCVEDGIYIQSLPIRAKNVLGALKIEDSKKFEALVLNDYTNRPIGTVTVHYEYGQIYKNKDELSWDVKLVIDSWNAPGVACARFTHIIYHNTLTPIDNN
jgi:hypothetical protein